MRLFHSNVSVGSPRGNAVAHTLRDTGFREHGGTGHTLLHPRHAAEVKHCSSASRSQSLAGPSWTQDCGNVSHRANVCALNLAGISCPNSLLFQDTFPHSWSKHMEYTYCVPRSGIEKGKGASPHHRNSNSNGSRQENKHTVQ